MKIPVLVNFDQHNQIGWLEIDETKLPEYSDYVFSLGYVVNNDCIDKVAKLLAVSLLTDTQYIKYLQSIGKLT